jgi:hypothetical protein
MNMTRSEIIEAYQGNLNMTLKELSRMSGWTVPNLKRMLLDQDNEQDAVAAYVAEGLGEW